MMLSKMLKNFYRPSIRFPGRKNQEANFDALNHFKPLTLSENKVKLTNRDALNQAMDE